MTTNIQQINVAIIGAGKNTVDKHIPGLLALPEVQIQGICNRSQESAKKAAATIPKERFLGKIYHNWHEAMHDPEVDAVVLGTPPKMHYPVIQSVFEHGKHILTEARFCLNGDQANDLYQGSLQNPHLVCQIVPAPFTFGIDATLQKLCQPDSLGEVLFVEIHSMLAQGIDQKKALSFREDKSQSGTNTMFLGIWYESLLRWLGPATAVQAMGHTQQKRLFNSETNSWQAVETPDHLQVSAQLACGGNLSMIMSQNCLLPENEYRISIHGSKLSIQAWPLKNIVQISKGPGTSAKDGWQNVNLEESNGWRVEEEFIRCIQGKEKVKYTTFYQGWQYMQFTDAALESHHTGMRVPLL